MIIHLEGGGRFGNQIINLIHFTGGYFFHPELKIYSTQFLTYFGYLDLHKLLDKKYNKHRKPINRYQRVFLLRILPVLIINAHKFIPGFKLFITNDSMLKKKHFLFNFKKEDSYKLDSSFFDVCKNNTCLCAGWSFRNWNYVEEKGDEIRNILSNFFSLNKNSLQERIGAHIRSTDFETHAGGSLFFDANQWVIAIDKLARKLNGKSILLTGDDKEVVDHVYQSLILKGHTHINISNGSNMMNGNLFHAFQDLYESKYIISAGSSFALAASWLRDGSVYDIDDILSNRFAPVCCSDFKSHDKFKLNWK